ncbi:hypothetical protein GLOTRDRAFT_140119 [Gloeophyllum trabeum ATCC 11539]|uniref:TPR-like protein n=1 Tax=Gloeophyllum trabeum (strain ATCC 11539 / FP-39264 / Madison 617) TaxID=670483 RepID=S7Q0K2_GLOTA|nr:uncharacterized protein GLOTRDRAFT_140119 [Gloeophyllum trabeum ATCC 11539]EPQ53258.1 hypothetical protein GLOTRDRAFT_140119 [Gloeophyllum trabeum ATCC 11539]
MSHAKDQHYWAQLRAALTAGDWASSTPAKTPKGAPLSWSELLRKFNKHAKGFTDVAEVASQTQNLGLLLSGSLENKASDGQETPYGCLHLGDECVLPEDRLEDARAGYEALKKLNAPNYDSLKLALAYYAYSLGRPEECLSYIASVPNISDLQSRLTPPASMRSEAATLQIPSTRADTPASSWGGSVASHDSASAGFPDINDGRAWALTESIRSVCLEGMCAEKLRPDNMQKAVEIYSAALPLITVLESELPRPVPAPSSNRGASTLEFSSFTRYRELWRWAERLLWRAIILTARTTELGRDTSGPLWTLLKQYYVCSAHWPPTFRTEHRATVAVLHLRAIVLQARATPKPPNRILSTREAAKPSSWLGIARPVIQEYRVILNVSTTFPKAGERNVKVEDFVDLCVAVWEASGAVGDYAGLVIDVLWWATRLTFNSYRIFRHMSRLLYVSGDPELAKRSLRLYVQVVGKARETAEADARAGNENSASVLGAALDADTDRHWVETLVQGARMLCRLAGAKPGGEGIEEAKEAGVMVEKARTRLDAEDKELAASVDLAEGIWSMMMANKELDPRTRPDRLSHALTMFQRSVGTFATPSGHYHLALAFTRPGPSRDYEKAIEHARLAVEAEPEEIRYWHLLGLLLVATGDWRGARSVLELGATVGEDPDEAQDAQDAQGAATEELNGQNVRTKDFGVSNGTGTAPGYSVDGGSPDEHGGDSGKASPDPQCGVLVKLLDPDMHRLPPPESLLRPLPDHPVPSRHDTFEYALQLRMTQLALAEMVEGPEGAQTKAPEVFRWFAEKRGTGESRRESIDSNRTSVELNRLSTLDLPQQEPLSQVSEKRHSLDVSQQTKSSETERPSPISINVEPATPVVPSNGFPSGEDGLSEKRSTSLEKDRDGGKKVQQMLKSRVHKGQARISTISKKIGHGVTRNGVVNHLRRTNSAPNFRDPLARSPYQASSIHRSSRRFLASPISRSQQDLAFMESAPPPPPSLSPQQPLTKWNKRMARERKLLSDLWLMSAATFRRLDNVDQAKGAIQDAEVQDPQNTGVWVQLGLYYMALNNPRRAKEAFQKALFISTDDIPAIIHLSQLYLTQPGAALSPISPHAERPDPDNVDLAAGMLNDLTRGVGWDVPEAWYFLAKAYGLQGRRERERECLTFALGLSVTRGVRSIGAAVGWCL